MTDEHPVSTMRLLHCCRDLLPEAERYGTTRWGPACDIRRTTRLHHERTRAPHRHIHEGVITTVDDTYEIAYVGVTDASGHEREFSVDQEEAPLFAIGARMTVRYAVSHYLSDGFEILRCCEVWIEEDPHIPGLPEIPAAGRLPEPLTAG